MTWTKTTKPTTDGFSKVSKPSESSITSFSGGDPIGLLLALTYSTAGSSILTGWTNTTKPSSYGFTKVAKPTT